MEYRKCIFVNVRPGLAAATPMRRKLLPVLQCINDVRAEELLTSSSYCHMLSPKSLLLSLTSASPLFSILCYGWLLQLPFASALVGANVSLREQGGEFGSEMLMHIHWSNHDGQLRFDATMG
jgi:hypothetical protein